MSARPLHPPRTDLSSVFPKEVGDVVGPAQPTAIGQNAEALPLTLKKIYADMALTHLALQDTVSLRDKNTI